MVALNQLHHQNLYLEGLPVPTFLFPESIINCPALLAAALRLAFRVFFLLTLGPRLPFDAVALLM